VLEETLAVTASVTVVRSLPGPGVLSNESAVARDEPALTTRPCDAVLAVVFAGVRAVRERSGGPVRVEWRTLEERDTLGFAVYRRRADGGEEEVGYHDAAGPGTDYEVIDPAGSAGVGGRYVVEERTSSGRGARSERVPIEEVPTGNAGGRGRRRSEVYRRPAPSGP
jgi:hypothetical protein